MWGIYPTWFVKKSAHDVEFKKPVIGRKMKIDTRLFASESYLAASPEVIAQVVNGCGTAGWKGLLVPDNILGICITPACNIHDWDYAVGKTIEDKDIADRCFLNNMLRLVSEDGLLEPARCEIAKGYYESVHLFGGPAFWTGKNPESQLKGV